MTTVLGMFVKPPVPGTVKTRLAADIGNEAAAELYAAFVIDLIGKYATTGDQRVLGFGGNDPNAAQEWATSVAGNSFCPWPQPNGDLGSRIQSFFNYGCELAGHDARVVLVGSDSPNLPREYVERAFAILEGPDVVIGPASEGGYYVIGMRGQSWPIFDAVEWSSPLVFEQTVANVEEAGRSLGLLPIWYDVDTVSDARMLGAHLKAAALSGENDELPTTMSLLNRLF